MLGSQTIAPGLRGLVAQRRAGQCRNQRTDLRWVGFVCVYSFPLCICFCSGLSLSFLPHVCICFLDCLCIERLEGQMHICVCVCVCVCVFVCARGYCVACTWTECISARLYPAHLKQRRGGEMEAGVAESLGIFKGVCGNSCDSKMVRQVCVCFA